jgi:uncharacterized protein YggT (Ycf19 family)
MSAAAFFFRAALSLYALAVLAFTILKWIQHPICGRLQQFLAPWISPVLVPLKQRCPPIRLASATVDISPWLLLVLVLALRELIVFILA